MGNTLTGQIVAETYEALLKVTDNGIITGTKKRITDGFGNDTPLLLSSTDVQIDGNFLLPGTTLQYVRGDGSLATLPTIISTLTTTGSSGASTLIGSTLNIPNYTLTGLGGVPTSRTLTINGTTFDLSANRSWTITDTGLTSVGISMPSAFTVSNSPLTSNGTIAITGAGLASQYIRGDGTLANFPTTGGGGSSVSYYMNGSVNQGTILGNTYYEFNKTPIIGAGTDFTINANGYISQFITDANDPALLEIPGGNWNFEMYFSASSGGGSPSFYVELYKYNGTAFTLIASNSTTPEGITGGTAIDLYTTALAVPQTVLTLTDRLAIRVYVTHSGRTITLHTENSHLCQVITTFSTGITALNSLTKQVQYFAVGTSGTDFAISSVTDTHTFNLPTASATNRGALSSANWTTFNNKENALTFSSPLSRSTNTISIPAATTSVNGYLTSTDWTTFNGKVPSTRTLTINGTAYDLSADRSWTIATGLSGSGTTNYVAKFTGTSSIGNSLIYDNGSNVGIGIASPFGRFHSLSTGTGSNTISGVFSDGSTNGNAITISNSTGLSTISATYLSTAIDSALAFQTTTGGIQSERMRITAAGNVGIGTSSPTAKLQVEGILGINSGNNFINTSTWEKFKLITTGTTAAVRQGSDANGLNFTTNAVWSPGWVQDDATKKSFAYIQHMGNGRHEFRTSPSGGTISWTTGLFLDETSATFNLNVGIGTASPSNKLQVFGSTDSYLANFTGASGGATARGLTIGTYTSLGAGDCGVEFNAAVNNTGYGQFRFSAGTNERMRIDSSGNVGIGIASPNAKLNVAGTTLIQNSGADTWFGYGGSYDNYFSTPNGGKQVFRNASSDIMTLTSAGNVLINTTSDNNSGAKLQVTGGISYQNIFNTQTASYTLALTDQSKIVETNVGSANNVTIPLDSSVNFPIGTEIQVLQLGAGQTTIVATSGVTTRSKSNQLKIANQNTGVTLVKRAANDWYVIGNLTA